MSASWREKDKHCYMFFAYAPIGTSARAANRAFNEFISYNRRGFVLFHDHFVGRAGGAAVFSVDTPSALAALEDPGPLAGWDLHLHPLLFADSAIGFLYQTDFTMTSYRKTRLRALMDTYEASDLARQLDGTTET